MISSNEKGLTLIELVISITILVLVLGGAYGFLRGTFQYYQHGSEAMDAQQNARIALNMIERDIRRADYVMAGSGPTSIRLQVDGKDIRYYLSGRQILKAVSWEGHNPVAYNVNSLSFEYYPSVEGCSLVSLYLEIEYKSSVYGLSTSINTRLSN